LTIDDTGVIGAPAVAAHPAGDRFALDLRVRLSFDIYTSSVIAIVLVQAAWLGWACARGWFYADDLSYLSEASGQSLGWHYLTASVNDHFVPGLRLIFWIMNRTIGLNYPVTIAGR